MGFRESRLFYKLIFDRFYKLRCAKFKIHLYFSREKTSNYNCHAVKVVKRKTLLYLSSLLCKTKGIFSTTIQQHDRWSRGGLLRRHSHHRKRERRRERRGTVCAKFYFSDLILFK